MENPRHYRKAEKRLAKAHRRVSRRTKGSNRRKKAVVQCAKQQCAKQQCAKQQCAKQQCAKQQCAKQQQKVRRQRQRTDFHHKTALARLKAYDTRSLENVRVANLVRNRHLAKSISAAGWAAFRPILDAKAACAGREVLAVPPAYTRPVRIAPAVGSACPNR